MDTLEIIKTAFAYGVDTELEKRGFSDPTYALASGLLGQGGPNLLSSMRAMKAEQGYGPQATHYGSLLSSGLGIGGLGGALLGGYMGSKWEHPSTNPVPMVLGALAGGIPGAYGGYKLSDWLLKKHLGDEQYAKIFGDKTKGKVPKEKK